MTCPDGCCNFCDKCGDPEHSHVDGFCMNCGVNCYPPILGNNNW